MTPDLPIVEAPAGYVYEWKRYSLHGVVDHANLAKLRRSGWRVVPPQRHGLESDRQNATVVGGLILMEKPAPDVLESKRADQRVADEQYNTFAKRLEDASGGEVSIPNKHREHLVKLPSDT